MVLLFQPTSYRGTIAAVYLVLHRVAQEEQLWVVKITHKSRSQDPLYKTRMSICLAALITIDNFNCTTKHKPSLTPNFSSTDFKNQLKTKEFSPTRRSSLFWREPRSRKMNSLETYSSRRPERIKFPFMSDKTLPVTTLHQPLAEISKPHPLVEVFLPFHTQIMTAVSRYSAHRQEIVAALLPKR